VIRILGSWMRTDNHKISRSSLRRNHFAWKMKASSPFHVAHGSMGQAAKTFGQLVKFN
jgi:hypothetical protein